MKTADNTILITGGGSGIGRGLAEAFHALGNQIIISGRNQKNLDAATSANPGMKSLTVDMMDAASINSFAAEVEELFPKLNVLINNAGIMRPEKLLEGAEGYLENSEEIITTNLLGPIRLTAALLPLLRRQPSATLMNVTSGLAFMSLAATPTYCATKAALHSYTESLRYQLRDTPVEVLELAPPYVATHLMGERQANDVHAMPLKDFIAEVVEILKSRPEAGEVLVQRVHELRFAEGKGLESYQQAFQAFNDRAAASMG